MILQIVRDRKILATHYTRIGSPYRPHTVYETITSDMAPSAQLVAYFIHKDGEITADAINFNVDINFQNEVIVGLVNIVLLICS